MAEPGLILQQPARLALQRTLRVTARTSGISSSTVTGSDVSLAKTLFEALSPTRRTSMPASSKVWAAYCS